MLSLYSHPLASYCHKVLIALYERDIPFKPKLVEGGDDPSRAALLERWPVGKIPLLHDAERDRSVPETSIIIEYLDRRFPERPPLLPTDPEAQLEARLWDRFFDLYIQTPMQKIVGDRLRPEERRDPLGVEEAKAALHVAYGALDKHIGGRTWILGDTFSVADCAAAPALFYSSIVVPLGPQHASTGAYFERLLARPSFRRVLKEASPYFRLFPYRDSMPARFLELA